MEIREALDASFNTEAEAQVETESTAAERARDESGRFARAEAAEKAEVAPAQPEIEPGQIPPAPTPEEPKQSKAPSSWRKEAQAVWDKVDSGEPLTPDELKLFRSEAERREGDFHKGIEGWRTHAEKGKAYEQAIAPFQENLARAGVDSVKAVGELLKVDHILRNAPDSVKVQKILEVCQSYGIDLTKQISPDVARYEQRLFELEQQNQQYQRSYQEQTQQSLNSDIEKFKAAPGREHFDAVREDMAALLQAGRAKDLDQAYDMAVYANPQTRAAMLEQQRREAAKNAVTQRASTAAASVQRGSSPASGGQTKAAGASLRDDIAAAMENT